MEKFTNILAQNKKLYWEILSIIGIVLLLGIMRWNSFTAAYERDEGEYAYSAWLLQHNMMPYENSFLQKPPMIIYTYLLGQVIAGDSVVPPRVFAFVSIGLSTVLFGLSIAKLYGKWAGHATMWFIIPMLSHPVLAPFAANTEVFMILPLSAVFFMYAQIGERANKCHFITAGVLSAIAVLYKPIASLVLLIIVIFWLYMIWRLKGKSTSKIIRDFAFIFLGFIITMICLLLLFLLHDSGKSLWECVVRYNYYYATADNNGSSPFIFFFNIFLKEWWILCILLVGFFIKRIEKWSIIATIFIVSLLTVYTASSGHYYIMVIPFWAAIAAIAIESAAKHYPRYFHRNKISLKLSVIIVVALLLILPIYKQIFLSPRELVSLVYGGDRNPFLEARVVAQHVSEISDQKDYVFVAGSEPQILYHAQRRSSSRFVIMYPLMINTPVAINYQRETIEAIKSNMPEIIVFVRSQNSWLVQRESPRIFLNYINQLVKERYQIAGGWKFQNREWSSSQDENMVAYCSIVVYKKKK